MRTIEWRDGIVVTIDQTRLPHDLVAFEMKNISEVAEAIRDMRVRGAPLLGAVGAFGMALVAYYSKAGSKDRLIRELKKAAELLRRTRPTAVNLSWALNRILEAMKDFSGNASDLAALVVEEAQKIADEDVKLNRLIGKHGAALVQHGDVVLTHCNAGALATVEYGTALGIVRAAWQEGKKIKVIATETRPKLQGARLTTYELKRDGIPVSLITDNMVGYVMYRHLVSKVIVGADRVVKDAVFNKIGTYGIAVLAKEHEIPFFVAAPKSTFDLEKTSSKVIIEERSPEEVTHVGSQRIAPQTVDVMNPAFDITPLEYVTAIICEDGILREDDFARFESAYKG